MNNIIATLLLLTISFTSVGHSNPGDDPRLAEIESFFTSHAEILQVEFSDTFGKLRIDHYSRQLILDGNSYPYPDQVTGISYAIQSDDAWLLQTSELLQSGDGNGFRRQGWLWYFYPASGEFVRYVDQCSEPPHLSIIDYKHLWTLVNEQSIGETYLCEKATGTQKQISLSNIQWDVPMAIGSGSVPVFNSPDNQWLLLFGIDAEQTQAYSYDLQTSALINLGTIPCNYCLTNTSINWFGDTVTIWVWDGISNPSEHIILSANSKIPLSLQQKLKRPYFLPEFHDDLHEYDYINFTTPENIWETQCNRIIYNPITDELTDLPMGPLCRIEWGDKDGLGYYRDLTNGAEGIAVLTAFDMLNSQHRPLFHGELEWIEWVSQDETHAIVILDDNGYLANPPGAAPIRQPSSPMLAYVDLIADEVVFSVPTGWHVCTEPLGGPVWDWNANISETSVDPCTTSGATGAIIPRTENTFLVVSETQNNETRQIAELISIEGIEIHRSLIASGSLIPFTQDHVIERVWDSETRRLTFELIEVDNSLPIVLTTPIPIDEFRLSRITDIDIENETITFQFLPEIDTARQWGNVRVTVRLLDR